MLSRNPEGKLCLEDGEGRVPLDMEDAVSHSYSVSDLTWNMRRIGKRDRGELMIGTWRRNVHGGMYGLDRGGIYY